MKKSSAQLTVHYKPDQLLGRQVCAVVNFPPRQIGPFISEVLTLGHAGRGWGGRAGPAGFAGAERREAVLNQTQALLAQEARQPHHPSSQVQMRPWSRPVMDETSPCVMVGSA